MIEINLLPGTGKKSRSRGSSGPGLGAALAGIGSKIKDPHLIFGVLSVAVGVLLVGALQWRQTALSSSLEEAELQAVQDSTRYAAQLAAKRAAAFLASSSRSGTQLRSVFLCGGGARVPGLAEALGRRLRLPVQLANPLANIRVRDGALDGLVTDEIAPLLMLPIGLALRKAA